MATRPSVLLRDAGELDWNVGAPISYDYADGTVAADGDVLERLEPGAAWSWRSCRAGIPRSRPKARSDMPGSSRPEDGATQLTVTYGAHARVARRWRSSATASYTSCPASRRSSRRERRWPSPDDGTPRWVGGWAADPVGVAHVVGHLVDGDGRGQDQRRVFAGATWTPYESRTRNHSSRPRRPACRRARTSSVVGDLALYLVRHAVGALEVEALAERGEHRLLDGREGLPAALDGHDVADADELRADRRDLLAVRVLDDQGLADPDGLAVDLVDLLAGAILDPEVVADGGEFSRMMNTSAGMSSPPPRLRNMGHLGFGPLRAGGRWPGQRWLSASSSSSSASSSASA